MLQVYQHLDDESAHLLGKCDAVVCEARQLLGPWMRSFQPLMLNERGDHVSTKRATHTSRGVHALRCSTRNG